MQVGLGAQFLAGHLQANEPKQVEKKIPKQTTGVSDSLREYGQTGIPPRLQWQNDHGYCGEVSIQSIGLYYGAWISQGLIRQIARGEVLLGLNAEQVLRRLHFTFRTWDTVGQPRPQFCAFMSWLKFNLTQGVPCIAGIYLSGFPHADYDHIVPVVGVISAQPKSMAYDPKDVLIYHNLFSLRPMYRAFGRLGATREHAKAGMAEGGNIPWRYVYGVAVTGLQDEGAITLPVRLSVDAPSEPNLANEKRIAMRGVVTVSRLIPGHRYILLRFDEVSKVPIRGGAEAFLESRYSARVEFQACDAMWTYADPKPIFSNGATYYRCFSITR